MTDTNLEIKPKEGDFSEDITAEQDFLSKVKGSYNIESELDLAVKVYNEQLEQLVRMRIDLELYDHLILAEPNEAAHAENKVKTNSMLRRKRKLITLLRSQIVKQVEAKKDE
jgi:hypothetical protein